MWITSAGIAVRNPQTISVGRHYGLTITTCVPADPQSKSGSEAAVRIAKADLVATDHNLRPAYASVCRVGGRVPGVIAHVNTRRHRATLEPPVFRRAEEHERLHRVARLPHTVCFEETRKVNWQSTISVSAARYSVPHAPIDERVWARPGGSSRSHSARRPRALHVGRSTPACAAPAGSWPGIVGARGPRPVAAGMSPKTMAARAQRGRRMRSRHERVAPRADRGTAAIYLASAQRSSRVRRKPSDRLAPSRS